jgi:hypothetical protein
LPYIILPPHPKLVHTFYKNLCPKLDDLFFSFPNLD